MSSQTQAKPRADEIETAEEIPIATPVQLRTRLRTKTPPPNVPRPPIPPSASTPPIQENLELGEPAEAPPTTEQTMSGLKRTAEAPVEEIDAARALQPQSEDADMEISIVENLEHILEMELNTERTWRTILRGCTHMTAWIGGHLRKYDKETLSRCKVSLTKELYV